MNEILNDSPDPSANKDLRFEYRFEEIETTALETVFDYLFNLLESQDR